MYLEFYNNNGTRTVRIVRAVYEPNNDGVMTSKKKVVKYLGAVSKFDDGKPDFEARMREDFKNRKLKIDGYDYDEAERLYSSAQKPTITLSMHVSEYPRLHPENYGYFLLDSIFEQLGIGDVLRQYKSDSGIQYDLVNMIKLFVYSRFIHPDSKRGTVLYQSDHPWLFFDHDFSDKSIWYRSLSVLTELDSSIQLRMNTKIVKSKISRKNDTIFYNVTNFHFEIPYPDEPVFLVNENGVIVNDEVGNPIVIDPGFRKKFKNKEERQLPPVKIGCLIDENGIPMMMRTFTGNTGDSTMCLNILTGSEFKSLHVQRMVFVADDAMYSGKTFYELVSNHHGYIVSKSVLESEKGTRNWILEDKDWTISFKEQDLNQSIGEELSKIEGKKDFSRCKDEINRENTDDTGTESGDGKETNQGTDNSKKTFPQITFKFKSRIVDTSAEIRDTNGELLKIAYKVKQCVYWSYSHYREDKHHGEKLREELNLVKENPCLLKEQDRQLWEYMTADLVNKKTGELLEDAKVVIRILEDKLDEQEKFFGYFMLETTEVELSEIIILGKYGGLSCIESTFGVCESDLDLRPIYVSTEEHMKAHVLICFIGLVIMRIIQHKIMIHKGIPTKASAKGSNGLSEDRIKTALTDCQAAKIFGSYYMMNEISPDQELINTVFEIPPVEVATVGNIKAMRTAINHYLI